MIWVVFNVFSELILNWREKPELQFSTFWMEFYLNPSVQSWKTRFRQDTFGACVYLDQLWMPTRQSAVVHQCRSLLWSDKLRVFHSIQQVAHQRCPICTPLFLVRRRQKTFASLPRHRCLCSSTLFVAFSVFSHHLRLRRCVQQVAHIRALSSQQYLLLLFFLKIVRWKINSLFFTDREANWNTIGTF